VNRQPGDRERADALFHGKFVRNLPCKFGVSIRICMFYGAPAAGNRYGVGIWQEEATAAGR